MSGKYYFQNKFNSIIFIIFLFSANLFSQDFTNSLISYKGSGNYILQERSNLLRYDNGRYVGLVNKQVYAYITPVTFDNYYIYEGNFYVQEGTKHNNFNVKAGIDDSIPAKFKINKNGQLTMIKDNGYPTFRSFPSYSEEKIKIGDSWSAKAERAVDPLNKGIITKLPIYVQYKYEKDDYFNDEPIFVISAQWATRYGFGTGSYNMDFGGDKDLVKASGSHKANLYVSKISGNCLLIQDKVDETFVYSDGNQYTFRGTISQFTEYPPAIDRSKIIPLLKRIAEISDEEEKNLEAKSGICTIEWNKSSPLSARSLVLQTLTIFNRMDEAVLYFDEEWFASKAEKMDSEEIARGCDEMIAGYQYLALEIISSFQKRDASEGPGTLVFLLKETPSRIDVLHSPALKDGLSAIASPLVSAGKAAFASFAENLAAVCSDSIFVNIVLIRGDNSMEGFRRDDETGRWLCTYLNSMDASKSGKKAQWVKPGAKPSSGFKLFKR